MVIAHLAGDIDMESGELLRESHERPPTRPVVLDLAGVEFMDSAGLGAVVSLIKNYRSARLGCYLATPSPLVARILKATAIHQLTAVTATVEEAVRLARAA